MSVLIGREESGKVRDAFLARGVEATSCDLIPSRSTGSHLPNLTHTHIVSGREPRVWKMPPGPNRQRDRSETYQGIADAMAEQWGALI